MPPFETCIFLVVMAMAALYAALAVTAAIGLPGERSPDADWEPSVTVVVVGSEPEGAFVPCAGSLAGLDYPPDKLRILWMRPGSGGLAMTPFKEQDADIQTGPPMISPGGQQSQSGAAPPRPGGLMETSDWSRLLHEAGGEVIFFIDAGCKAPREWIRTLLKGYGPETDAVAGFASPEAGSGSGTLPQRIQSLDRILRDTACASWANWGFPVPVLDLGNLSIRRRAAGSMNARDGIASGMAGDELRGSWRIRFLLEGNAVVHSPPAAGAGFSARSGGAPGWKWDPSIRFVRFVARMTVVAALCSGAVWGGLFLFWILTLSDGLLLLHPLDRIGRMDLFRVLIPYEVTAFFAGFPPLRRSREKS
jgi:hypothetical protein